MCRRSAQLPQRTIVTYEASGEKSRDDCGIGIPIAGAAVVVQTEVSSKAA
jgi:hypothetical protein